MMAGLFENIRKILSNLFILLNYCDLGGKSVDKSFLVIQIERGKVISIQNCVLFWLYQNKFTTFLVVVLLKNKETK